MSRKNAPLERRLMAVAGALSIGAASVVATSAAAFAKEPAYGNIDQNATGSIIIHKHLKNDSGIVGNVDGTADAGGDGVDGVTFKAFKITDLDLSKPTDWDILSGLAGNIPDSACANPAAPTLGPGAPAVSNIAAAEGTTSGGGVTTLGQLPVAAYLVCETAAPANIVEKAKPFVVTIPFPNTTNGGDGKWLYDVHAYPKNQKIEVSKTISDQTVNGVGLGSRVTFPVSTTLPSLDPNTTYSYFYLRDTLDSRLGDGKVDSVTLGATVLTENTDYKVRKEGQTLIVSFMRAGLAKLKDNPGEKLVAVFSGRVDSVGDGTIKNKADLVQDTTYGAVPPNEPGDKPPFEPENPPTTPEVATYWGNVQLFKYDADTENGTKVGLAGAKFNVYNAVEPYAADCSTATKTGSPIAVGSNGNPPQTVFVSDAAGLVKIDGLYVGDSEGSAGAGSKDATKRCYVVEEIEAPAGFVLPQTTTTPIEVVKGEQASTSYNAQIKNKKQSVPQLPLTGASGQLLMTIGGASLALIAAGSTLVIRSRKRGEA